jgi:hypothetical protein
VATIEKERALTDERAQSENDRWAKLGEYLKNALRKAKD